MSHLFLIAVPDDASPETWAQVNGTVSAILGAGSQVVSPAVAALPVQVAVLPSSQPQPAVRDTVLAVPQPASQPQPQPRSGKPNKARFAKGSPEAKAAMQAVRAAKASNGASRQPQPSATQRMQALAQPQPAAQPQPQQADLSQAEQAAQDAVRFANVDAASISPEGWQAVRDWATNKLEDKTKIAQVSDFLEGSIFLGSLAGRSTARGRSNLALDIARKAGIA